MDDFLGTSIQYSERQLILLEQQHKADLQKTVEELIKSGFLDSDYEDSTETESESEFEHAPEPINDEIDDNSNTEIDETIPLSTDNQLCNNILFAFIIGLLHIIYNNNNETTHFTQNNNNNMYKYNANTSYYSTSIYYTPLLNEKECEYSVLNYLFIINFDDDSIIDSFICDCEYKLNMKYMNELIDFAPNIIGRCVYNDNLQILKSEKWIGLYNQYSSSHLLNSDNVNYTDCIDMPDLIGLYNNIYKIYQYSSSHLLNSDNVNLYRFGEQNAGAMTEVFEQLTDENDDCDFGEFTIDTIINGIIVSDDLKNKLIKTLDVKIEMDINTVDMDNMTPLILPTNITETQPNSEPFVPIWRK